MITNLITFDIETAALSADYLLETFKPTFEPNKSLKDPAKVEVDIAAKRQAWLDESALHAERGKVLAIGFKLDRSPDIEMIHGEDEKRVLTEWLAVTDEHVTRTFVGFNSLGFDLPFIRRRCIINGIAFPYYDRGNKWKPWQFATYDAMLDWGSGNYREFISLNNLARALGLAGKNGKGDEFAAMYRADQAKALAYLENDVILTEQVCERMLA